MKRRIPGSFNLDLRGSFLPGPHIFGRQLYVCSAKVFFETRKLRRAGNGNDPRLFRKQPGKRDLRGRCLLLMSKCGNHIDQSLIRLAIVLTESGHSVAEVGAVELRLGVNLAGQETLAKRAERNEPDSKLF